MGFNSGFKGLKNVQNVTYLQILTEIKVIISFTLCIFSFHFEESKKRNGYTSMSENRYTVLSRWPW